MAVFLKKSHVNIQPSKRVLQEPSDSVRSIDRQRASESVYTFWCAGPVSSFVDVDMESWREKDWYHRGPAKVTGIKVCSVGPSWPSRGSQLLFPKAQLVETVKFPSTHPREASFLPHFQPRPVPPRTYLTLHPVRGWYKDTVTRQKHHTAPGK